MPPLRRLEALAALLAALAVVLLLLGGGKSSPMSSAGARAAPLSVARRDALDVNYGRIPLAFVPNRGQSANGVRFLSQGAGYSLGLTSHGAILVLARHSTPRGARGAGAVGLRFLHANPAPAMAASARLPGRVNYLLGNVARRWHTRVPTYARVTYRRVWPGIDVTFYGNQTRLEYDFRLQAGADPGRISLAITGARTLRLGRGGDLLIAAGGATVDELAPRAYQRIGGRTRAVASRYVLLPGRRVAVRVGAYDRRRPLTIDPVLVYSTLLGGAGNSTTGITYTNPEIAVDAAGDVYVGGPTVSASFPTTAGAYQGTYGGGTDDGYVAKLNPSGTAFDYVTYLGGNAYDYVEGVAVDSSGDAYAVGGASSTNFPTTTGAYQTASGGGQDAFISELDPTGAKLLASTLLGGSGDENGYWIALNGSGQVVVTGSTGSTDFPTTTGAYQTANAGGTDLFVSKLNSSLSTLIDSTYLGGSSDEGTVGGAGLALDSAGDVYVAGDTDSTDFPTTAGAFQRTYGHGATDSAFVTKLNPSLSSLLYSTYLGGNTYDYAFGIAVDGTGAAYVTGEATSPNFPTTAGAYQTALGSSNGNAFVTKLNPAGSALEYSTYLGGTGGDFGDEIAVDSSGSAYVSGGTSSTDFPTTSGAQQTSNGGNGDGFVAKLNPAGTALVYSTYLGGSGFDIANGIALGPGGAVYVAGSTGSTDFPLTSGAAQSTLAGNTDGYVVKLDLPVYLRSTSTAVGCSPGLVTFGNPTSCLVFVTDADAGPVSAPSGTVTLASSPGGGFVPGASCTLTATATPGLSACGVSYTAAAVGTPSAHAVTAAYTITAAYGGDTSHAASQGTTTLQATAGSAPAITVTTKPASAVTTTAATLHGALGPPGVVTGWQFQYGRTAAYGHTTPVEPTPAGSGTVSVSWKIKGLAPRTRYHFRLVGVTGSAGTVRTVDGGDRTFTTAATGRLVLDAARLRVSHGVVSAPFTCASSVACVSKLSIVTRGRLATGKRSARVVCATTKRAFKIRAHKRVSERASLRAACRTLLRRARGHRLRAKLTANPRTGQRAAIRKVTLTLVT